MGTTLLCAAALTLLKSSFPLALFCTIYVNSGGASDSEQFNYFCCERNKQIYVAVFESCPIYPHRVESSIVTGSLVARDLV